MISKLLCMNVEVLKDLDPNEYRYHSRVPAPQLCSVFLTPELLRSVKGAIHVIDENDFVEAVLNIDGVNWFASIEERYFHSITSQIHVKRDFIYFSGAFSPCTQSVFQTKRVPIGSIIESLSLTSRTIDIALLDSAVAIEKIDEIAYLDKELNVAYERSESLGNLKQACIGIKHSSIGEAGLVSDKVVHNLLGEITKLESHIQKVENKIQAASMELCEVVLGVSTNDRLLTQIGSPNRNIEIIVRSVSFHSGTIYIEGPKVLKNGKVGKRHETAYVKIMNDNERS